MIFKRGSVPIAESISAYRGTSGSQPGLARICHFHISIVVETRAGVKPVLDILRLSGSIMGEKRLGDVIDDFCVKCRRITNHSIVSLLEGEAAKVRCRTCYHDHDYRREQAPPSKKDLKKAEAEAQAALALQNGVADGNIPAIAEDDVKAKTESV
jgi:hypothetical protein